MSLSLNSTYSIVGFVNCNRPRVSRKNNFSIQIYFCSYFFIKINAFSVSTSNSNFVCNMEYKIMALYELIWNRVYFNSAEVWRQYVTVEIAERFSVNPSQRQTSLYFILFLSVSLDAHSIILLFLRVPVFFPSRTKFLWFQRLERFSFVQLNFTVVELSTDLFRPKLWNFMALSMDF